MSGSMCDTRTRIINCSVPERASRRALDRHLGWHDGHAAAYADRFDTGLSISPLQATQFMQELAQLCRSLLAFPAYGFWHLSGVFKMTQLLQAFDSLTGTLLMIYFTE